MKMKFVLIASLLTFCLSACTPRETQAQSNQQYLSSSEDKITYTIDFELNGGSSPSYKGPQTVEYFTQDIFFFDCIKQGYNFRGWSYNNQKIFDEKGNQLDNPIMSETMTFVALYSQTVKLTITTNMSEAGTITGEGEYPFNTKVNVSAHPYKGYSFVGWYLEDTLLSDVEDYRYMMWNNDVTIEARFKLNSYKMDIYSNNSEYGLVLLKQAGSDDYEESYSQNLEYTTNVSVVAYSKTDTRFLGWYDVDNKRVEVGSVYNFFMPNHDYELEAKWNHFTITYELNGGTNNPTNPSFYTIESDDIVLLNPTKNGYDFVGWSYQDTYISVVDTSWIDNIVLTAVWKAITYSITYELNGGTNNADNPSSYNIEGHTISLFDPYKRGYDFMGWYTDSGFNNRITKITTGLFGDLKLYAKWAPIVYSIDYILDGGTLPEPNPITYTIESSFELKPAVKDGYQFSNWVDENNQSVSGVVVGTTGDLVFYAIWSPNLNSLSVESSDYSKGTVSIVSGSGYFGETIVVTATSKPKNIFKGWYVGSELLSTKQTYSFVMPDCSYSLVGKFEEIVYTNTEKKNMGITPVISSDGKTVTYGLYPQTRITDDYELMSTLLELGSPNCTNGLYLYKNKYYSVSNAGFYECTKITWNILSKTNNEYLLLSNVLLDAHCYYPSSSDRTIHGSTVHANNYEYSDIMAWLNGRDGRSYGVSNYSVGGFFNVAFGLGNSYIQNTSSGNWKVFLLSSADYRNTSYGFTASLNSSDSRRCLATDYAKAVGGDYQTITYGYGKYWNSSPNTAYDVTAGIVGCTGDLGYTNAYYEDIYVRPAITIKIS